MSPAKSSQWTEAIERMIYVTNRGGFAALVGPQRVGKTRLLSQFRETVNRSGHRCIFLDLAYSTPRTFLQNLADGLGLGVAIRQSEVEVRYAVDGYLRSCAETDQSIVILADHADRGDEGILREIRRLRGQLNSQSSLLVSLDSGRSDDWRQFIREQGLIKIELKPFTQRELSDVLEETLEDDLWTDDAKRKLAEISNGELRRLFELVELASLAVDVEDEGYIDGDLIDSVARELAPSADAM